MKFLPPLVAVVFLGAALSVGAGAKGERQSKPELTLHANRTMGFAPIHIILTGQVKGGPDNYQGLYCPTIEWDWGDGTISSSSGDCEPYQPQSSTINRIYITDHVFKHGGKYAVTLRLKQGERVVAAAETDLEIQSALDDIIR